MVGIQSPSRGAQDHNQHSDLLSSAQIAQNGTARPRFWMARFHWASCPIPFSVCPDLISIKGESGAVTKLLPGRPNITEVYWNQSRYRDGNGAHVSGIRIIPAILPELKRIRLLSIKDHGSSREPKLTKLVQWMPVLVILEVFHLPRVSYSTFIFKDCYDVHHPYRRTF